MDIILSRLIELIGDKHGANKELADFLGIQGNNITNWKAGRSDAYKKYLPQIAAYYGVSLDWLSGLSDEKGIKNPPAVSDEGKLNEELISLLCQLDQEELKLVDSYVRLILSAHKE